MRVTRPFSSTKTPKRWNAGKRRSAGSTMNGRVEFLEVAGGQRVQLAARGLPKKCPDVPTCDTAWDTRRVCEQSVKRARGSAVRLTSVSTRPLGSESIRCSSRFGTTCAPFSARRRRFRSADADPAGRVCHPAHSRTVLTLPVAPTASSRTVNPQSWARCFMTSSASLISSGRPPCWK
jgi:hypothetical protein